MKAVMLSLYITMTLWHAYHLYQQSNGWVYNLALLLSLPILLQIIALMTLFAMVKQQIKKK